MLHRFKHKADVLNWLFSLGDGVGLPRKAKVHLEPFLTFRLQERPCSISSLEIRNETTGELIKREEAPNYAPSMPLVNGFYRPELEDFELKFELPAVVFSHFEEGFDRMGDVEVAIFDIVPEAKLEVPHRFSARNRMHAVLSNLSTKDLHLSEERASALYEWFDAATEGEVRRALTERYAFNLTTDEALSPYLSDFNREFGFFYVFLQGKGFEELQAFEALQASKKSSREFC